MEEMMSLRGKVIVVRGAAQGIGRAIAALAIHLCAMVVGADLNAEKLEALATAKNGHLLPYVGSVADPEFAEATVRDVRIYCGHTAMRFFNNGCKRSSTLAGPFV